MFKGKTGKRSSQPSIAIVLAMIFTGSVFLLFARQPEHVQAVSSDGMFQISAVGTRAQTVVMTALEGAVDSESPVTTSVYEVSLSSSAVLREAEIVMNFSDRAEEEMDLSEMVIYSYDPLHPVWQPIPTFFDLTRRTIAATVRLEGTHFFGAGPRHAQ